jgi:diguanylate cyclase (GGDEF)-like protein/PAS domain S-box-containing protein
MRALAGALAGAVVVMALVIAGLAWRADRQSVERARTSVLAGISTQADGLGRGALAFARGALGERTQFDDLRQIENAADDVGRSIDLAQVLVISAEGKVLIDRAADPVAAGDPFQRLVGGLDELIQRARQRGVATGLLAQGDAVVIVAAATSTFPRPSMTAPVVIFIRPLGQAALQRLTDDRGLDGLAFRGAAGAPLARPLGDHVSLTLTAVNGLPLATLDWRHDMPWRWLLLGLAPAALGGVLLAFRWAPAVARRFVPVDKATVPDDPQLQRLEQAISRAAFERAAKGIFRTSSEGKLIDGNLALAAICGYPSVERMVAALTDVASQLYVDPKRQDEFTQAIAAHGEVFDFVAEIRRGDGRSAWVSIDARVLKDPDGRLLCYIGTVEDISEQTEATRQLAETRGRLAEAVESIASGMAYFDSAGHLVLSNAKYREMYAHAAGLIVPGVRFDELVAADIVARGWTGKAGEAHIEERLAQFRAPSGPIEQIQSDGRWLQISERRTADGGVVSVHTDITGLKRRERELAQSSALLKATLNSIGQGLAAFDAERRLTTWNDRFFELLDLPDALRRSGQSLIEILGHQARRGDFGAGDPLDLAEAEQQRLVHAGAQNLEQATARGIVLELRVNPLREGGLVVTATDITARKWAEQALRDSEARYALAVKGANDGLWDWDLLTNRIFFSARWKSMLGYGESAIGGDPEDWFQRVHPEDIDQVRAQIAGHLAGVSESFESEHRMRHDDSSYRWVLTRGLAVRGDKNLAVRMAGSQTDITERKRAEERLVHGALHDALTGLPNRALLADRLDRAVQRARRHRESPFAVLHLDLDRFKVINDSLGYMHGDELLIGMARRLEPCLKPGDTLARLSGDEFAVLIDDMASVTEATAMAERIHKALAAPFRIAGQDVFTSASTGIVLGPSSYERADEVLRDADLAMYRAKAAGNGRAEVFDATMHAHAIQLVHLETDLRRAVERGEMLLYYQPIVSLETGRIVGFETLVRWNHPERGLITPDEFVPLAEETGLIVQLGEWVLSEACRQMWDWQSRFVRDPPLVLSVNLSVRQFNQLTLVGDVCASLARAGLDPRYLKLEITETALMENAERAAAMLAELKRNKITLCLDDFGTGYSSLSYLHKLPIDTIKIDKSFVSDMVRNKDNLEIVRTIALLAHNLGMDVIAEGVETPEQLAQLRALGCQAAQGYLFSRPLHRLGAEELLRAAPVW